ncbi:MAG: MerR family transcriptional regulator [Actinobacteria bacterium]|nr:MerR family transcriptional regulator [Actinomycetota bacterium]
MASQLQSIGQVLKALQEEFPDISISKIRFLEAEGLIAPERAPSGYRRYSRMDIDRLAYVLRAQKNHYLPLKVIREHLALIDQGAEPPAMEAPTPQPMVVTQSPASPESDAAAARRSIRLTRRELLDVSGLPEATLVELERQLVIRPRRGTAFYGREALTLAVVARKLTSYGIDARHLRAIKMAAEREVGLVAQAVASSSSRRQPVSRERTNDVMQLVMHAHAALMQSVLDR